MSTSLAPDYGTCDQPKVASLDVREIEDAFLDECARVISRSTPRGARPRDLHQLGTDLKRERGTRTLTRVMRWLTAACRCGADGREFGEVLADVIGAAVASALCLSDASIAETLAECEERPAKEIVVRPTRTLSEVNAAIAAGRETERTHADYMRALYREKLALVRGEQVA